MNIIEAAKFIKSGKKVMRKHWDRNTVVEWTEDIDSVLADDWEVVEEKSPMELAWMKMSPYKTLADPFDKEEYSSRKIFEYGWNEAEKHFKSQQ